MEKQSKTLKIQSVVRMVNLGLTTSYLMEYHYNSPQNKWKMFFIKINFARKTFGCIAII